MKIVIQIAIEVTYIKEVLCHLFRKYGEINSSLVGACIVVLVSFMCVVQAAMQRGMHYELICDENVSPNFHH